ncbi:MAG: hypothetical protein ACM3SY_03740 [Candidatus Omnitrophota bacterium]
MMVNKLENKFEKMTGLAIIAFILIVYLPSIHNYLAGDDFEWLDASYGGLKHPSKLLETINHFFRPLIKLTYLFNYAMMKTEPVGYNVCTLAFHLINVALLFLLMVRVTRRLPVAGLTALAYGISAKYSEVTLWSAGRPDSVLLIFMLGVLILLNGRNGEKTIGRHAAILGLAVLAAGAKETWVLLPFLALGFLWIVKQKPFLSAVKSTVGLFLLLILYVGYFIGLPLITANASPTAYGTANILTMIHKFGFMLASYVGLGDSFTGTPFQLMLVALTLILLTGWMIVRKNRLALFGLIWMLVTVAISLPIYFSPSRYNYLPLVGFWMMVMALLECDILALMKRFSIKKVLVGAAIGSAVVAYTLFQVLMLRVEAADYRQRGDSHQILVEMYRRVKDAIPPNRPLVFIDLGQRRAVDELARHIKGYRKLLFVRERAIWQQVFLGPMANFAGDPFARRLASVPPHEVSTVLSGEWTVLVFTDSGFFIPRTSEYKQKVRSYFGRYGQLPYKVEVLRWEQESI